MSTTTKPKAHDNHDVPPSASKDIIPQSSSTSLRSPPASHTPQKEPPRGRAAWKHGTADYLDGLRALPEVRPIPWVPGKELPAEKSTESARSQTRGAFMLATRGKVNDPPCNHCATGVGKFMYCVSLDDWFHGACATCQMATRGNLCSLRIEVGAPTTTSEFKLKPLSFEVASPSPADPENPQNLSTKRKRNSEDGSIRAAGVNEVKPYSSPYAALNHGPSTFTPPFTPSTNTPSATNPYPNYSQFSNYPQDDPSAPVNYIYKRQDVTSLMNPSEAPENLPPKPTPHIIQPAKSLLQRTLSDPHTNSRPPRELSTSLSPSVQLLESQHSRKDSKSSETGATLHRDKEKQEAEVPVIDYLPRKKQKQLFGILGGLQSDIKRVRDQADSMQKQFDLLQAALGVIDEEDT